MSPCSKLGVGFAVGLAVPFAKGDKGIIDGEGL